MNPETLLKPLRASREWRRVRFRTLPPSPGTLCLQAPFDQYTGYGQHACAMVRDFLRMGYQVHAKPLRRSEVPDEVASRLCAAFPEGSQTLLLDTAQTQFPTTDYWFTMYETSRVAEQHFQKIAKARHLIVPSRWNASCFSAQGIKSPIHVCPLGFDPEIYSSMPSRLDGPCVFGILGTPSLSNATRKNFEFGVKAFLSAFEGVRDVRLKIKQTPTCPIQPVQDSRIEVCSDILSEPELAAWYRSLTALFLPSRGEGWGFPALHAMACGRPVVAADYGGLSDFFGAHNGYPIEFGLERPIRTYYETGLWASPTLDSAVAALSAIYRERHHAARLGEQAAKSVAHLTWAASHEKLADILSTTGFFEVRKVQVPVAKPAEEPSGNGKHTVELFDVAAPGAVNAAKLPVRPGPLLLPVQYCTTCFVHLGRYGDLLNILPVLKRSFDETGHKPTLVVSSEFADVAMWASYYNVESWEGPYLRVRPAVEWAKKRYLSVTLTQPCAEDWMADQECASFAQESWRLAGCLDQWGKLPLVLDRRNAYREFDLIKAHRKTDRPLILYSFSSHSSPFARANEVHLELHRQWKNCELVDISKVQALTVIDLLGLMDRAACLLTADSALLHLAVASKVPVLAFLTNHPSRWNGTLPRARVVYSQRYDEAIDFDTIHLTIRKLIVRRFIHAYSEYKAHGEVVNRHKFAEQSWPKRDPNWIECPVSDSEVGSKGGRPLLKEIIDKAAEEAAQDDVLIYTNRDIALATDGLEIIRQKLLRQDALYAYRRDLMAPRTLNRTEALEQAIAYDGCDLFAFTLSWWQRHRGQLPDFVIGAPEWDRVLRQLIESENDGAVDGAILHLWHEPPVKANPNAEAEVLNKSLAAAVRIKPRKSRFGRDVDLIRAFYRRHRKPSTKHRLLDFTELALSNNPSGIGDALLLSSLPKVSSAAGRYTHAYQNTEPFRILSRFNPYYRPYDGRPTVSADLLQTTFDMGNGHFTQRLARAFGFQPELRPGGVLVVPNAKVVPGKCALHFDPGAHANWQRIHLHHRARELYRFNRGLVEDFVKRHQHDMRFCEVGKVFSGIETVENCTGLALNKSVELIASCEWFIGIISGPMHIANALGVKCIVLVNFPHAEQIVLPTLVDISQVESEWFYPQAVHLHQDSDGPLVREFSVRNLERALEGGIYPYWSDDYLNLIHEQL